MVEKPMNETRRRNLIAAKNDVLHAQPRIILLHDRNDAASNKENLLPPAGLPNTQLHLKKKLSGYDKKNSAQKDNPLLKKDQEKHSITSGIYLHPYPSIYIFFYADSYLTIIPLQ